jgi:hypothetical protein
MVGKGSISRSTNNGPFIYTWETDGSIQNAAVSVASLGVAIDAIKPFAAGMAGVVQRVTITVVSV